MGLNFQSESTKEVEEDFSKFINENAANIVDYSSTNCSATNSVYLCYCDIPNYPPPQIDNINITQKAIDNCTLISSSSFSDKNTFTNKLKNVLSQFVNQASGTTEGWLSLGLSAQIQGVSTCAELVNTVINVITTDVTNTCSTYASAAASARVPICGRMGNIDINQSSTVTSVTSCINKSVITAFLTNTSLSQFAQKASQYEKSVLSGIASVLVVIIIAALIFAAIGLIFGKNKNDTTDQQQNKSTNKKSSTTNTKTTTNTVSNK